MPAQHIAIVPARAGSKGIKDKNLTKLQGKSLIRITLEKLMESKLFHTVVLTTDYPKSKMDIGDIRGNGWTKFLYLKRPENLAKDSTNMTEVISHVMTEVMPSEFKYTWLFQPTCPFTSINDIKNVMEILKQNEEVKSVISFKDVKEHTNRCYTIKEKSGYSEAYKMRYTSFIPRQKLMKHYIRSGNIYVTLTNEFLKNKTLENKPVASYLIDRPNGTNIDEQEDLVLAKYWLSIGRVKI